MRNLIVSEFVSLDGVMEAPGGEATHPHSGWVGELFGPEVEQTKFEETSAAGSMLLGRVTWQSFSEAWPTYEGPFADTMNAMPKHVVSTTLRDPGWNTMVLAGDVLPAVQRLKDGDGRPILVHGSCRLVHALLPSGLIDELRLMVFPVSIGRGLRVFPDEQVKLPFLLVDQQTFPQGVVELTYQPA